MDIWKYLKPYKFSLPEFNDFYPKLGQKVSIWKGEKIQLPSLVIIGFPEDSGVQLNGGRIGAANGPDKIRQALYKLSLHDVENSQSLDHLSIIDAGNVNCGNDLRKNQELLGMVVHEFLSNGHFPLVLGGGHETVVGHYLGYHSLKESISLINIDAHADVKPLINGMSHSGSGFREILEMTDSCVSGSDFFEFGLQGQCNSLKALEYLQGKEAHISWISEIRKIGLENALKILKNSLINPKSMVSVDLDCISAKDFPFTSANPANGFSTEEFFQMMDFLGKLNSISSLDLVEFNPVTDAGNAGANIVGLGIWKFLLNLQKRFN